MISKQSPIFNAFGKMRLCIVAMAAFLLSCTAYAQTPAFPYNVSVSTIMGNCYDDCRILITMHDAAGNEVLVNPTTHNAQNTALYPLYNIQYHYRNVSAGANTHYDTLNDIQVTNGTYCIGVTAYVPVTLPDGTPDYAMVDTTLCNIEVTTNYNHLEASVLSGMARNRYEWSWDENDLQEFCGWRPAFDCADVGRIQLKLIKGKFPYRVIILDNNQDTIRQAVFNERQQSGVDSMFADFRDFYTFDQMPVGNYSIKVSDSCDYSLWLSIEIPSADPNYFGRGAWNNVDCADSNVVRFYLTKNSNTELRDYCIPYFDSILQYRFINPGGDTTAWFPHVGNIWDPYWLYIQDTITQMNNYCPLYNDSIRFQIRDLCHDTIYSSVFLYTKDFSFVDEVYPSTFDMVTTPDTCLIHALSGLSTQTYNYYGYPWGCYGCGSENDDTGWMTEIPGRYYTCPLSYDVYSAIDSSLISHAESDDFSWLAAPVTFTVDTTIPVHIAVTDARGCELISRDTVFVFNVANAGDISYPYETHSLLDDWGWNGCCWDRYLYIRQIIDAETYRQNMTVHLIESPLYNRFNFTAVRENGEWSFTADDTANHHTYIEVWSDNSNWQLTVRDSVCLAPGRYTFAVTSSCGTDLVSYTFTDPYYIDSFAFDVLPQYDMEQVCDRLIVTPHSSVLNRYVQNIIDTIDNNEPIIDVYTDYWYDMHVVDGVAGGYSEWRDGNGNFVFTIPGRYVIETYCWESCTGITHYDTIDFVPQYIDFDQGYAIVCDNLSNTGFVSVHAYNGRDPYTYYLYDQSDLSGNLVGTSSTGNFPIIPMTVGQQLSVMAEDSCHNSFYINLTATPINQSALAWEFGDFQNDGHCEGDSVFLAALPFLFNVSYQWYGPNGFSSTDRVNSLYLPYGSESGYYTLEIFNTGCATQVKDSVYIAVIPAPTVTILSDTTVCSGDGVTLAFQTQGTGTVHYDIVHSGAPTSGYDSFTAASGATTYHTYPIESDNVFWAANIYDNRCTYNHIIDTVTVSLYNPATTSPVSPNTTDGYACYNHTASLKASSTLQPPYYVHWYLNEQQNPLLQCDTITNAANQSTFYVNNVTGDTTLYVTVSSAAQCPATYGTINHLVNMHNGTTLLNAGEGARFFDSGGELDNYGDNENLTHTFSCSSGNRIELTFNSVEIAIGDTLRVYAGTSTSSASPLATLTHNSSYNSLIINQSAVTFNFHSNWANNRSGWNIDLYTDLPMTAVSAHISPLNYDTVAAVVCASPTPFQSPYFPPLDISQAVEYLNDTLISSADGCQTNVHLHVVANPVSQTTLHDSLMPCQLPFVWNGVTFTDFSTKSVTFTNIYGCDSIVTMTLHWAPPIDSTDVYDTIVENQLPYTVNGATFTEAGTQTATLTNQDGCDSIVTTHLFVHANVTAEADSAICDNLLPFVWNGVTFTHSDTQTVVLTAHTGADSTLTMYLTVNPTHLTAFTDTVCQYAAYQNYGFSLSETETSLSGIITLSRTESNIFGCDSVTNLTLLIIPVITPNFYAEPDKAILSESPNIHFVNTTDISEIELMGYYWRWDFDDGTIDSTTEYNNEHLYTQWGDYTVTLTLVIDECESSFSVPVIIETDMEFPNVITPNGDGINDVFIIKDLNPERSNRLVIVDRWGKVVWDEKNYQTYMKDGMVYNADKGFGIGDVIEGVYYYTFYYEGAVRTIQFNGSITVIK